MAKEPKDSKYRKIGEEGEQAEKSNGVWRFKDSAVSVVDRNTIGSSIQVEQYELIRLTRLLVILVYLRWIEWIE